MNIRTIISRKGLLVAVLMTTTGAGIGLTVTQTTPTEITPIVNIFVENLSTRIILATLGVFLITAVAARLIRSPVEETEDSDIIASDPETPVPKSVPQLRDSQLMAPFDSEHWVENSTTNDHRKYAMYGRRVETDVTIPEDLQLIVKELSITARDTYATVHNCKPEEAAAQVAEGTWTDERTVATFLATETGTDSIGFTIRERAMGWIFTESVIEKRITQTLDCIDELQAETYLSRRMREESEKQ